MKRTYSTVEVAREIRVSKITLLRWLWSGKLSEPKHQTFGGVDSRIWSEGDLNRARLYREQSYRKRS